MNSIDWWVTINLSTILIASHRMQTLLKYEPVNEINGYGAT